ncbi:hypothetical protein [Mycolicibacterium sp.]|uniref:hypothetical protein n=1 Tax=Mycolicibacterium sp. TaxID=2320850 RepID=UPI003560A4D4
MTRVSNIDHIVILLRQKLLERSRTSARGSASSATRSQEALGAQAVTALDTLDDRQLRRAVIQDVLAEQFGRSLTNDAEFQQIVERVTSALEEDRDAARLFSRVTAELRRSARQGG